MNWREILRVEIDGAYRAADRLIDQVDERCLSWMPESGQNWMAVGQLLHHLTASCGAMFRGFVAGEWDFGDGQGLPSVPDLASARERLAADREAALRMLSEVTEEALIVRRVAAPWEKEPRPLGYRLSLMIDQLNSHKSQLFYYLKLQGKPIHTGHLWGT